MGRGGSGWGLPGWGHGHPPQARVFSLRAFYLERSNLPTDASTTAVKIDQVRHLLCCVCGGSGGLSEGRAPGLSPTS